MVSDSTDDICTLDSSFAAVDSAIVVGAGPLFAGRTVALVGESRDIVSQWMNCLPDSNREIGLELSVLCIKQEIERCENNGDVGRKEEEKIEENDRKNERRSKQLK